MQNLIQQLSFYQLFFRSLLSRLGEYFPKDWLNFSNDHKVNLFSYNTPSLTEETRLQTDFVEALFHLPWFVQFFQPHVTIRRWKISTNTGGVQMKEGGWGEKNQDALQAGRASVCRVSKQEKLSPRTNWGEEKKRKTVIDTKNQWSRIHRHMIEQLSLTTVQKALTVVNECLLSFSPSSLSFSFTPSVSSQFAPQHLSRSISNPVPLSFRARRKEGTSFLERNVHNRTRCFDRDARACVCNPLHRPSPLPPFFFHCRAREHTREKTRENRCNRGRQDPWTMSRLSSVPLQLKSPFILCTVSDCVCCAYKVWTMRILKYRRFRLSVGGKKIDYLVDRVVLQQQDSFIHGN